METVKTIVPIDLDGLKALSDKGKKIRQLSEL